MSVPAVTLPEGVREGNDRLIKLTEAAVGKVRELRTRDPAAGEFLRVAITGGGVLPAVGRTGSSLQPGRSSATSAISPR